MCVWVAAALHYALLASLTWMGIEIFHTFWLVYMVFSPSPKPYLRNIFGYGEFVISFSHMTWRMINLQPCFLCFPALPAVPVCILVVVGDIYGMREVEDCEDTSDSYRM